MTSLRWADALRLDQKLRPLDKQLLLLLARLPFLPASLAAPLVGCTGRHVERRLARLLETGAMNVIQPAVHPGHTPRLYYLTDLGLAVVALGLQVDVTDLARCLRLRRDDLLARLPGLVPLLAAYKLLAAVAASRPGSVTLLAWLRPWQARFRLPNAKTRYTVQVPAHAALCWKDGCGEYLLVPDLGDFSIRVYQRMLDRLALWQRASGSLPPPLVIATLSTSRAALWRAAVNQASRHAALHASTIITTWSSLSHDAERLARLPFHPLECAHEWAQWIEGGQLPCHEPSCRLRTVVGANLTGSAAQRRRAGLGQLSLHLTATDYILLDLIGRHPFLTVDEIAVASGWSLRWASEKRNRVQKLGLLRLVEAKEIGQEAAALGLTELTRDGLALVAARQGLPSATAVRVNGLTAGGPESPPPGRAKLLQTLSHTLGVNAFFIDAYRTAAARQARGYDDALTEWRSGAACATRLVRPDGYGAYRHDGRVFGFFLEFDRGTMKTPQYHAKFAAYYTYLERRLFEPDYDGMPTVLVVTTDTRVEDRIVQALRQVSSARLAQLPVLLTCTSRLYDPRHSAGLLAPIWRTLEGDNHARVRWPILQSKVRSVL